MLVYLSGTLMINNDDSGDDGDGDGDDDDDGDGDDDGGGDDDGDDDDFYCNQCFNRNAIKKVFFYFPALPR